MSEEVDLDLCFETALSLAEDAGKMIRESIYNSKRTEIKTYAVDLVTETDKQVESFLIGNLKEKFPDHKFIGEESKIPNVPCDFTDTPTWIIDPVDGTMNFVHTEYCHSSPADVCSILWGWDHLGIMRFPFVAVSIGLAVNKEVVVGIVYNPILEKMYTARKGQGAFCNGNRLHVSGQTDLTQSLVMSEIGSSRSKEKIELLFANMRNLIEKVHSLRATGSGALNMCVVASGEADAYFEFGIHCWDIAAGTIIVREAGGTVIDSEGGPLDIMSRRFICAASPDLAQSLSKELKQMVLERD